MERPLFAGGYKGAKQDIFFGTQQMGAKNGKGVESESLRELKAMHAPRVKLTQVHACRASDALLLLSPPALHLLLPHAVALHALAVLGAHLLGAAENAMLGTFAPTTSQRMLRSHPQLTLPIHPLRQAARHACQPPPSVSGSC
jgi:hypothetical protein|eukprot:COSAG06_NODE_4211_length_4471_cov_176.286368_3_plen_143_part_00